MKLSATKIFRFEAAHNLPYHQGKCANVHGHNYKLEVTFGMNERGLVDIGSSDGMIIDFTDLKELVNNSVIIKLDHANLNDHFENPTAELMVIKIAEWIRHPQLIKLKLWETDDCFVVWEK